MANEQENILIYKLFCFLKTVDSSVQNKCKMCIISMLQVYQLFLYISNRTYRLEDNEQWLLLLVCI